jgi:hypothetical protein
MSGNGSLLRTGWASWWTTLCLVALAVETVSGLLVTLAAFHAVVQWWLLLHTAVGLVVLVPLTWYVGIHWLDYRRFKLSDTVLLGYVAGVAVLVCAVSGLVVTAQGVFATRMTPVWRELHLWSTFALLAATGAHLGLVLVRRRRERWADRLLQPALWTAVSFAVCWLLAGGLVILYAGPQYRNELPADYSYLHGKDRPFAPSLALTSTGGAFDEESLANSRTCGTSGCHAEILAEWLPSAHRYAAMDPLFQKVQLVMAEQNGPESTRYCGGCHDPISLFAGTKNLFRDDLTALRGYQEGVSCLACHSIHETDVQGNANYVATQPPAYLWQWEERGAGKAVSDFLIRTYPAQHRKLSKRMYKAPEYCAACHKQFVDQEVNRVGWVQLQNQYDNWKASHWFVEGDAAKTVECRECHMPLVDSRDPARGDDTDYNRSRRDGKHRSHRFIAANTLVPRLLALEGWQQQVRLTEAWLQGRTEVPEIRAKWRQGDIVELRLEAPPAMSAGERLPVRVVMAANKVGHDFPTGPLDIIQSWVELHVVDERGNRIFSTGRRDGRHFIEPGSFLFKAEPVDQHGNLIDRHNLWEMVGVRYRRSLFPGYSDTVEYLIDCPTALVERTTSPPAPAGKPAVQQIDVEIAEPGTYRIEAALLYRKVDQFLVNFLLGEGSGLTAPVVEITRASTQVRVLPSPATADVTVRRSAGPAAAPAGG